MATTSRILRSADRCRSLRTSGCRLLRAAGWHVVARYDRSAIAGAGERCARRKHVCVASPFRIRGCSCTRRRADLCSCTRRRGGLCSCTRRRSLYSSTRRRTGLYSCCRRNRRRTSLRSCTRRRTRRYTCSGICTCRCKGVCSGRRTCTFHPFRGPGVDPDCTAGCSEQRECRQPGGHCIGHTRCAAEERVAGQHARAPRQGCACDAALDRARPRRLSSLRASADERTALVSFRPFVSSPSPRARRPTRVGVHFGLRPTFRARLAV